MHAVAKLFGVNQKEITNSRNQRRKAAALWSCALSGVDLSAMIPSTHGKQHPDRAAEPHSAKN